MPKFVTRTELVVTADGTFRDADVTSHVGADAGDVAGVLLEIVNTSTTTTYSGGPRKNGSTDTVVSNFLNEQRSFAAIGVDASDILEIQRANTALKFYIIGYLVNAEAVFLTNYFVHNASSSTLWMDVDITAAGMAGTALSAFGSIASSASTRLNFRKNGSTDDRNWGNDGTNSTRVYFHVPVDGGEIFEVRDASGTAVTRVWGCMTANYTGFTNEVDFSTGTTGSYVDADMSASIPSTNTIAWMHMGGGTSDLSSSLRTNGSSDDFYWEFRNHGSYHVQTDSGRIIEQKIESTAVDLYLSGYSPGPTGTDYNESASGGAVLSGSAAPTLGCNPAASGGIATSGAAAPTAAYTPSPIGGAVMGGTVTVAFDGTCSAAGGIVMGGACEAGLAFTEPATGGMVTSGTAGPTVDFRPAPAGGIIASGTCDPAAAYAPAPSGGATAGGSSITVAAYAPEASGTAIISGTAESAAAYTVAPAGGMVAGGTASQAAAYEPAASGTATTGGTAGPQANYQPPTSGGAVLAGSSEPQAAFVFVASGGISLTGNAEPASTAVEPFSLIASPGDLTAIVEAADMIGLAIPADCTALAALLDIGAGAITTETIAEP